MKKGREEEEDGKKYIGGWKKGRRMEKKVDVKMEKRERKWRMGKRKEEDGNKEGRG